MISTPDRHQAVALVDKARVSGARLKPTCQQLGIDLRTYQRWTRGAEIKANARPGAVRPGPATKLSAEERTPVLAICHEPAQ